MGSTHRGSVELEHTSGQFAQRERGRGTPILTCSKVFLGQYSFHVIPEGLGKRGF